MKEPVRFSLSYEQLTGRTEAVIQNYASRLYGTPATNRVCAEAVLMLWCDLIQEANLEVSDTRLIMEDTRRLLEMVSSIKRTRFD
ncbi:hypothetical protein ABFY47_24365 [Enterobacter ludwigii]|uniref:hypothetical protein n=1 Tax=Enterobacter ludwigii TaxID=299767 RepID=UPI003D1FA4EE